MKKLLTLLVLSVFPLFGFATDNSPYTTSANTDLCAKGIGLDACAPKPLPRGCQAGYHWSLAGTGIAHCVADDPACGAGTELTHDFYGNPSCVAVYVPPAAPSPTVEVTIVGGTSTTTTTTTTTSTGSASTASATSSTTASTTSATSTSSASTATASVTTDFDSDPACVVDCGTEELTTVTSTTSTEDFESDTNCLNVGNCGTTSDTSHIFLVQVLGENGFNETGDALNYVAVDMSTGKSLGWVTNTYELAQSDPNLFENRTLGTSIDPTKLQLDTTSGGMGAVDKTVLFDSGKGQFDENCYGYLGNSLGAGGEPMPQCQ